MTVIRVFLDSNCPLGHSVYANSDNNGPWGDALTREFLPLLQERFRCDGAFLVKGHSSGGWTSLYLQTHYPSVFAGCTASAPDYADFRSFDRRDLYQRAANPSADSSLPHAPTGHMEDVLYRGEQSMSFAAVFSPRMRCPNRSEPTSSSPIIPVIIILLQHLNIERLKTSGWKRNTGNGNTVDKSAQRSGRLSPNIVIF